MADHLATTRSAAKERAARTFLQGLGTDLLIAIALLVTTWAPDADLTSGEAWTYLGLALAKTVLVTAASYVMRLRKAPTEEVVAATYRA